MSKQSMTAQADEKTTDEQCDQPQKLGPKPPDAVAQPDLGVFNPSGIGAAVCSLDASSMTAFGVVSPANCVGSMTAVILDGGGHQVAVGVPVAPPGPPANWAFNFTNMPTGTPRPLLTLVVTATNGPFQTQSSVNFRCG